MAILFDESKVVSRPATITKPISIDANADGTVNLKDLVRARKENNIIQEKIVSEYLVSPEYKEDQDINNFIALVDKNANADNINMRTPYISLILNFK